MLLKRAPQYLIGLLFYFALSRSMLAGDAVAYGYRVVQSYPHSTEVFTQGLEFHQGMLYEGAGGRGQSMVLVRTLNSTDPIKSVRLEKHLFGEGITILNQRLYQLTWQSRRGFVYDADDLDLIGEFAISGEGWGITNNGRHLIMSNGTSRLAFLDPKTFATVNEIDVNFHGNSIQELNELEWVEGVIYANVWRSNVVVMIDPVSGGVTGVIDLIGLLPDELRAAGTDVLNGIAYDRENKRLFVTGKYWPRLYHIELAPKGP